MNFLSFFWALIPALIQAVPVNIAARFLGGSSTYVRAFLVTVSSNILSVVINHYFGLWAGIISFAVMIVVYKFAFSVGFLRAFFIWLVSLAIAFLFIILLFLLGLSALVL